MPKKVISYKLNSDGTIPDYVDDCGYFPNGSSWDSIVIIGVSKNGADLPNTVTVFSNELSLVSYLNTYTNEWVNNDFAKGTSTPFNPSEAAALVFEKAL